MGEEKKGRGERGKETTANRDEQPGLYLANNLMLISPHFVSMPLLN